MKPKPYEAKNTKFSEFERSLFISYATFELLKYENRTEMIIEILRFSRHRPPGIIESLLITRSLNRKRWRNKTWNLGWVAIPAVACHPFIYQSLQGRGGLKGYCVAALLNAPPPQPIGPRHDHYHPNVHLKKNINHVSNDGFLWVLSQLHFHSNTSMGFIWKKEIKLNIPCADGSYKPP